MRLIAMFFFNLLVKEEKKKVYCLRIYIYEYNITP